MALTDESNGNGMVMPVSPMYGGGFGGNNGFDGDGWWIILLFLLLAGNNGWGNGFGSGNGGSAPYMIDNSVQRGFDQSAVMSGITSINSGLSDVQQALCNGFAGVNSNISNGFATAEIADNARQIANMQTAFNSQTAITGAITDLASQQAQCLKKIFNKAKEIFGFTYEAVGTYA